MSEGLLEFFQLVEFVSVAVFAGLIVFLPLWHSRLEERAYYYRLIAVSGVISLVCIYLLHFKN